MSTTASTTSYEVLTAATQLAIISKRHAIDLDEAMRILCAIGRPYNVRLADVPQGAR